MFNSRIVREVKGKGTETPYKKSRLIIQGYNDEGKKMILTQSPTIQRSSQIQLPKSMPDPLPIPSQQTIHVYGWPPSLEKPLQYVNVFEIFPTRDNIQQGIGRHISQIYIAHWTIRRKRLLAKALNAYLTA